MKSDPSPESFVPYEGYSDLHCASEGQIRSRFTLAGYDRGELTLQPRSVGFRGMRGRIECPDVTAVGWATKAFPWPVAILLVVAVFGVAYFSAPAHLTWKRPLPYVIGGILIVGMVQQSRERWIEVTYRDGDGLRRVYFRREPVFGFGSSGRRTQQLYDELCAKVLRPEGN